MKKVSLIILDGFGITAEQKGNAITKSTAPYIARLMETNPKALLRTSSQEVGLPWGEVGNSEVGHSTMGLGRVVLQDLPQIDKLFESGEISEKNTIKKCLEQAKSAREIVHIMGIASDGAVHGHIEHIIELSKLMLDFSMKPVLHLIADGRDVPERSLKTYIEKIEDEIPNAEIASLSGRYYSMDRDKNYDRTEKAYRAMHGDSSYDGKITDYIDEQYKKDITDEFLEPASFGKMAIESEDPVIFTNFRADRALQITRAFADKGFYDFKRDKRASLFATMTTYDDNLPIKVLFSNLDLNNPQTNPLTSSLPEIISQNNIRQFHIAETEKFAHVTYFFAGGVKKEFKNQLNKIIPSEKVKSYDQFPQMRAREISEEIIKAADSDFGFIVANFANGDMVGHSGSFEKTAESISFMDGCLKDCVDKLLEKDYLVFLTADHGNADEMIDLKSGKPSKEHSINPTPFVFISGKHEENYRSFDDILTAEPIGILSDVAPTILSTMGLDMPIEMTGTDLRKSLV